MDFKHLAPTKPHLDQDTEEVMSKYQPVFTEYSILAE